MLVFMHWGKYNIFIIGFSGYQFFLYDAEKRFFYFLIWARVMIKSRVVVRNLFDGTDATDYFHFREGACNLSDSPDPYNLTCVECHLSNFTQMSHENAISRIYRGYHFRHATGVGEKQGKELGAYVFENHLREINMIPLD